LAHTRPVRLFVTVACAFAAIAALPAVAEAQVSNDNYLDSIGLNSPGTALPGLSSRPDDTIVGATAPQADILEGRPGGPIAENTGCLRTGFPQVDFGSTVWYDIFPHRPGNLRLVVESSNFGAFVGVVPYDRNSLIPDIGAFRCGVASLGTAILDYPFRLQEGAAYTIQVGGFSGNQGPFSLNAYFDPDTDRDGLLDSGDACPNQGGANLIAGCPDTDGDGVIDGSDRCQGPGGTAAHSGCPDADRDGKIDPDDACQRESTRGKRDRNDNGCPDRELLKPETKLTPGLFCTGTVCHGIRVNKLVVSEIPRGTRVTVTCTKHACKKASKKVGKSRHVRFFSGQKLEAGVGLAISLSRKGYVSRRITYWIKPNDWKKTNTCLKSGKPVRCSPQLLVR
jgi:hypothetical protein